MYILDTSLLSDMSFANVLSHFVGGLFIFRASFEAQMFYILIMGAYHFKNKINQFDMVFFRSILNIFLKAGEVSKEHDSSHRFHLGHSSSELP